MSNCKFEIFRVQFPLNSLIGLILHSPLLNKVKVRTKWPVGPLSTLLLNFVAQLCCLWDVAWGVLIFIYEMRGWMRRYKFKAGKGSIRHYSKVVMRSTVNTFYRGSNPLNAYLIIIKLEFSNISYIFHQLTI